MESSQLPLKFGLIVTLIFFIIGFVVYYVPHVNPFTFNTYPNKLGASAEHWLGTTSMGQDVVWLLIEAIHNSLVIGLIVAFLGTVVGVFVGLLSAFAGGLFRPRADDCYGYVRCYSVSADPHHDDLPDEGQLHHDQVMALVLAMFAWAWPSRQIRSMALSIKERDFIHTAKFSGESTVQIVVTEILPYALTWSLSNFMNATLSAIGSESSLAVLGLSPGNLVSLGNMIQWARSYNAIFNKQYLWIGAPIVATVILFVGLFLLITGYNDYLSMKRGR